MAIIGTAILLAACLFMFYALVKFHTEVVRPHRPRGRRQGVIVFRHVATKGSSLSAKATHGEESSGSSNSLAQPLPFGVRRLAVKSAARR